jgi:hypothetical protein
MIGFHKVALKRADMEFETLRALGGIAFPRPEPQFPALC